MSRQIRESELRPQISCRYARPPLTGPEGLTHQQAADIISEVAGKEITYKSVSEQEALEGMLAQGWPETAAQYMIALFQSVRAGAAAEPTEAVKKVLGREPVSFLQFAREHADAWR